MYYIKETSFDEVDVQEWNDLLLRSEVCDAFQTYEWAQVLRNSKKAQPSFLIVQERKEVIGGVMFLKKKMFRTLDSYEVRGGPIYVGRNKETVVKIVLDFFQKKHKRSMYLLFIPSPLINSTLRNTFQYGGYHPLLFRTVIIDLRKPLKDIWRALNKKARWGVRKAERLGVDVKIAGTWQEWKRYYNVHVHHSRKRYISTQSFGFFEETFKLHRKDKCQLFIAKCGGEIIAGSLFLLHRENMIFLQNASLDAFLTYNPNNLIQWRSIEWAAQNGITTYDLNGLPWEGTKYLRGIYEYKKRWDGYVQPYYYYLNRRLVCSGVHLIRASFFAWKLLSSLGKYVSFG